jgi:type VI secretion system secreted protein Hcp
MKMRFGIQSAALCAMVLTAGLAPGRAGAALNAYMKLSGQKQGAIRGDVTQKGREGSILGVEFRHEIISPRDAASGLPTGKRQHKPIVFTAELGSAHPSLIQALCTNEKLSVEFTFWKLQLSAATGVGAEVNYMTIKLTNAVKSRVTTRVPNTRDPALMKLPEMSDIDFTYESIEVKNNQTGKSYSDDWIALASSAPSPVIRSAAAPRRGNRVRRTSRLY